MALRWSVGTIAKSSFDRDFEISEMVEQSLATSKVPYYRDIRVVTESWLRAAAIDATWFRRFPSFRRRAMPPRLFP
jgi:hypothetical protein